MENTNNEKQQEANEDIMVLRKPVEFEKTTRKELDLSALKDMTVKDLIQARRLMNMNGVSLDLYPERSLEYPCYICSVMLGIPYEFFEKLSAADGWELKNRVRDFLY